MNTSESSGLHFAPNIVQDPREGTFVQNPYPFYEACRELGPVVYWEDYAKLCCVSFHGVDTCLRSRSFARVPPGGAVYADAELAPTFYKLEAHSLLENEPPTHTQMRRQVLRAFTPKAIADLSDGILELAYKLIDDFPQRPFDLLTAYAEPIPVAVISRILGVDSSDGPQLLLWSHAMVAMYQARRDEKVIASAEAASVAFTAYITELLAEKRAHPTNDILSDLANAQGDVRLSDDALIATVILLLNAGHEATVHAIGNGVFELLRQNADCTTLMAQDTSRAHAVNETLRYCPPLHMFTRYAQEDVQLEGHHFKRGDEIALLLAAANRDPALCQKPHIFDPTRSATPLTSFGAGIHFCIGTALAKLEIDAAFKTLFDRLPTLAVAEPPVFADRYHFHGLEKLMVTSS